MEEVKLGISGRKCLNYNYQLMSLILINNYNIQLDYMWKQKILFRICLGA